MTRRRPSWLPMNGDTTRMGAEESRRETLALHRALEEQREVLGEMQRSLSALEGR